MDDTRFDRMGEDCIVFVTPDQKIGFLNIWVSVSIAFYILANLYDDQRAIGKMVLFNCV